MKEIFSTTTIILCLFFFQIPYSFSQDTQKEKPKKEANKEDMDNEDDTPKDENVSVKKKKGANNTPRVAFGFECGLNLAVLNIDNTNTDINVGGSIGALVDIRMFGRFYIQSGLFYVINGGDNIALTSGDVVNWSINTIEIPVNIEFKTGRPGTTHFIIGLGPYFANNISGNSSDGSSVKIGSSSNDQLKMLDIGIGFNIGLELKNGLFFRIREQRGLSNLQPSAYGAGTVYAASDAITIGYLFGKKAKHKAHQQHQEPNVWDQ